MTRFIIGRLISTIPVLLGVSLFAFFVLRLAPGDPVMMMMPADSTQAEIEELRRELGLDQPVLVQYFAWLRQILAGNFGTSLFTSQPVLSEIMSRFPNTLLLAVTAIILAIVLGMPLGIIAATRRGTAVDSASMVTSVIGWSMPNFWLGLILIMVFGVWLRWLPTGGMYDMMAIDRTVGDVARHLILPALTLATAHMAYIARFTRSSLLEVLGQDYVRTARAKGLSEWLVVMRHALRNSLIPIISVLGVSLGHLLGGAVIVEAVFSWPGLGTLLVQSISNRDFPIVQGGMLFAAIVFIFSNLVADLLYAAVDPRIRYG
ncbi:nickel ABC transporter permease [Frigidibacter sp. ROC022]|uniref:nickel ABC transporter permease n=1 Tax=Frigidibacter sp. ROC022 TaxID=2971796 RepID=UPI00215B4D35|nr:nickel ABC transporter permease [Frigidibacter sp. ROC022]MCR8724663.1 ABC transporter permease [Frigidibacter sp. ROC022]